MASARTSPPRRLGGGRSAAKEGREKVVVYANSSKFEKLIEPWAKLYPDIKLDGGDTDGITTKMQAEQQAGNVVGDVWFNSDGHILYVNLRPSNGSVVPPAGLEGSGCNSAAAVCGCAPLSGCVGVQPGDSPGSCPLTNWWQLVDPKLAGKIFMENPLSDPSTTAKFTLIVAHADEMAALTRNSSARIGRLTKPPSRMHLGSAQRMRATCSSGSLALNQPVLEPGGDEVDTAYASKGMDKKKEAGYGFTAG